MADTVTQLVARLWPFDGFTEDICENVLHVGSTGSLSAGDLTDCMNALRDFYNVDPGAGQTNALAWYVSGVISRTANVCQILAYETDDLTGATPMGAPIGFINFTMGASSGNVALPQEVAIVASYHGDLDGVPISQANPTPPPATIRPAQRRKGRLYFGPLNTAALASGTATDPRPGLTVKTDLAYAFAKLAATIGTTTTGYLGVWSKADAEVWQYEDGYVDNAFDTQRRRGVAPNARTAMPVI